MLSYITDRLQEPSTYAGLASILGVAGIHFVPGTWQGITAVLTAVAGLIAIIAKDGVVAKS